MLDLRTLEALEQENHLLRQELDQTRMQSPALVDRVLALESALRDLVDEYQRGAISPLTLRRALEVLR